MSFRTKKNSDMKQKDEMKGMPGRSSLNMRNIFRFMMEEGYYPKYEKTHIIFEFDDNTGVVQYQEGILSIRVFFTIEEEAYGLFLEGSNATMIETLTVKTGILDDMKNIMFSCEIMCDSLRDLKRFFPRGIDRIREALVIHKEEMKKAIMNDSLTSGAITAAESFGISLKTAKPLS